MKNILNIVLLISISGFCSAKMTDNDYVYALSYECMPNKDSYDFLKYHIHFDQTDKHVVILNENDIYKSYETTSTPHLFQLNGLVNLLEISRNDEIFTFKIKSLPTRGYLKGIQDKKYRLQEGEYFSEIILFDRDALTYSHRKVRKNNRDQTVRNYDTEIGFCTLKDYR